MSVQAVLDTSVLVYTQDADELPKHERAIELMDALQEMQVAALTTQVLGEYFTTVTRRFRDTMDIHAAEAQVADLASSFPILDTTVTVVLEAARGVVRYQMSYYDAQIWAAARLNGISLVLSEDFQDGREVEGVRFANPFAEGFDLEHVLGDG